MRGPRLSPVTMFNPFVPMKSLCPLLFSTGLAFGLHAADLPLRNSGFEDGLNGWAVAKQDTLSSASSEAARSNNLGLLVNDLDDRQGSGVASAWFPAAPGKTYEVAFWSRVKSGDGVAVYLRFRDAQGRPVSYSADRDELLQPIPRKTKEWTPFSLKGMAPPGTAAVSIWIHSFSKNKVVACFDDFTLAALE